MVHGWLNFDKAVGISSMQALAQVKRIFGAKKAGYLGTLDPLASGLLPIALGEATKTIPYLPCNLKRYDFTVKWGEQKDTDDSCGDTIKISSVRPRYDNIYNVISNFIGEILQTPPQFSAIKINGVRAYELARSGRKVDVRPRLVRIYELRLVSIDAVNNSANFSMLCGSGVYVRSVARDLGIKLSCLGHITKLRRTMVGNFKEGESVTIQLLVNKNKIIPIASALKPIFTVKISIEEAKKIKRGQEIALNSLQNLKSYDIVCLALDSGVPVAISSFVCGYVRPIRVFNI